MIKQIKKIAEETKVACRNARRDIMDKLKNYKKNSEITEDQLESYEKDVQKSLDSFIVKIDNMTAVKEKELMQV